KEFQPEPKDFGHGSGAYDPYGPIREKFEAARKKFKEMQDHVCSLVLFNAGKPLVDLSWRFIYAAMLGNLAIQMPFDRERGVLQAEQARSVFHTGGKMIRYAVDEPIEAQNTTISAIIVLQHLPLGGRRLSAAAKRREAELGRQLTIDEFWNFMASLRGSELDPGLRQLRVVVHDNPYARHQLSEQMFRGPFDERYGTRDEMIVRLYAGEEVLKLEADEEEVSNLAAK
ncbi:MAG: hypothetical protein HYY26_06785, partial [Acidobacteria bacterium]|nr:hypothetical protein [Acidobacteriota bacterium]